MNTAIDTKKRNPVPRFIYFAGVDGSGKSTYVDLLIKEFKQRGLKAKRVWLRFNYLFTKPVLLYCRIVGLTRRPLRGGKKISVHDFYKSPSIGKTIQYLHFFDTYIHYFFKVYLVKIFTGTYILCDRFVYDILADFMIENRDFDLPKKPIAKSLLKLIPKDAKVLYFSVSKSEILKRKPSVLIDDEDFDLKYDVYRKLENYFDFDVIDNDGTLECVYPIILKKLGLQK